MSCPGRGRLGPGRRGDHRRLRRAGRAVPAGDRRRRLGAGPAAPVPGPGAGPRPELGSYPPITILHAAAARVAMHRGDPAGAPRRTAQAQLLRPCLTYALPHLAVQARIELTRCHLALSDLAAAGRFFGRSRRSSPAAPTWVSCRARPGIFGTSCPVPAFVRAGSLSPDRCRATPAADAPYAPVVPSRSAGDVPVPQHHQVADGIHLPQAGRHLTPPGGHPVSRAGAAGGVRTGLHFPFA